MTWVLFWKICSIAIYAANILLVVYVVIRLILRKTDPIKTLSWLLVLILLPYVGLILYLLLGQNFRKQVIFKKKRNIDTEIKMRIANEQLQKYQTDAGGKVDSYFYKKLILQNLKNNYSFVGENDEIEFYFSGKEALEAMLAVVEKAEKHIHLQSFIFYNDTIGNRFKDALMEKARSGVEVRVMYDSAGCWGVKRRFFKEMRSAGVEVLEFSPIRILMPTSKMNYRNHRKILVVDGKVGFVGGVNIADKYIDGGVYEQWRDTQIKITGESVFALQQTFLLDRYFIINRHLPRRKKYYPTIDTIDNDSPHSREAVYSQIVSCGPDSDWSSIMQCYFTMITNAQKSIYINTPYFIPSESLLNAIRIAALGGVSVNIMIPERTDLLLAHYGSMSYVAELLRAGVNVYLFKPGFNHSKSISIDGALCVVGSANMDSRSMTQDFEITAVLYDEKCAQTIESQFRKDASHCTRLNLSKWEKRSRSQKTKEAVSRLVSPLL